MRSINEVAKELADARLALEREGLAGVPSDPMAAEIERARWRNRSAFLRQRVAELEHELDIVVGQLDGQRAVAEYLAAHPNIAGVGIC